MTDLLFICGLITVIAGLFYFLVAQNSRQLKQINIAINKDATERGLKIKSIIYPGFNEWSSSPFEREIRIGSLGFEGIPYNREYYRILKCLDQSSNSDKTMWVRATKNYKTKKLSIEWMEQTNAMG